MAVIELNGNHYTLAQDENGKANITQSYVRRLSSAIRTVGVQQRQDDTSVNRYVHPSFPKGLGWNRQNRETGRGVGGFAYGNAWTMGGPVSIAKLYEGHTLDNDEADYHKRYLIYKGELWGLFEQDFNASQSTAIWSQKFNASDNSWENGNKIDDVDTSSEGMRVWDACVHKGGMYALTTEAADDNEYEIFYSTGAGWSTASGTGWPAGASAEFIADAIARRNTLTDDIGRLLSFGNTLVAAMFKDPDSDDGDGTIAIYSTADAGTNWVNDCNIPSGYGPKALVDWYDLSLNRSPVLVASEGVYSIDITNNAFSLMYPLDGHSNTGRWSVIGGDGSLYIGTSDNRVIRLAITDSNVLDIMTVGPPGDGFPAAYKTLYGITCLATTPSEWLLVAVGGGVGGYFPHIFAVDTSVILKDEDTGKRYMPWHVMYEHNYGGDVITGMQYTTAGDAVPRLHFAIHGIAVDGGTSKMRHIEYAFDNPEMSSNIVYHSITGTLVLPSDDLGDPQTDTIILQALVDADDLSADTDDEYITLKYGLNGAASSTTTLGNFLSGTKTLTFGSSSEGVTAKRIQFQLEFDRGSTTGNSPKMHEFEFQAQHIMLDKKAWDFTIDIGATARDFSPTVAAGEKAEELIITNLETVAESNTLVTFTNGRVTQTRVRIPSEGAPVFNLAVEDSFLDDTGYRTGFVTLRVEEGI